MIHSPTMQIWTEAWHSANPDALKGIYSEKALIFPPNKPTVQGNENILEMMKSGLGKVDVFFEPENLIIHPDLAFEYGIFKDLQLSDHKILGIGKYSVTWILENAIWKVLCHAWSMPEKKM